MSVPGRNGTRVIDDAAEVSALARPLQLPLYYSSEPPPVRSRGELQTVIRTLADSFDVVLVNAPSFLKSAYAASFASAAGSVLVAVPDGGSVNEHEELARRLAIGGTTTIGYVYC